MKIRNRVIDIKTLQTHILQDYFRMALAANFPDDTWKPIFYNEVQKGVKYSLSFVGAWNKIQLKSMDHYSINDMDTSIIIAILKGKKDGPFNSCYFNNIYTCLDSLQNDRNIDAHITGNETDYELFDWACGSLYNINKFISAVSKAEYCKVSCDERNSYARKYQVEIEALSLQFKNDYDESFKEKEIEQTINWNVERIKTSKDPFITYVEIKEQYLNKQNDEGKRDFIMYNKFMQAASDAGIVWACCWIGDIYFEGLITDVDYIKAAEYYEKGFDQLVPKQKLRLASIYINNLCSSSLKKEEGMTILKSCESPRWKIITYSTKEGYEFYSLKKKE